MKLNGLIKQLQELQGTDNATCNDDLDVVIGECLDDDGSGRDYIYGRFDIESVCLAKYDGVKHLVIAIDYDFGV